LRESKVDRIPSITVDFPLPDSPDIKVNPSKRVADSIALIYSGLNT